jgi:hypothetical protein
MITTDEVHLPISPRPPVDNETDRQRNSIKSASRIIEQALKVGSEPANHNSDTIPSYMREKGAEQKGTRREQVQNTQLAEMYDEGILGKLDCIIVPKTETKSRRKARGGIVLL